MAKLSIDFGSRSAGDSELKKVVDGCCEALKRLKGLERLVEVITVKYEVPSDFHPDLVHYRIRVVMVDKADEYGPALESYDISFILSSWSLEQGVEGVANSVFAEITNNLLLRIKLLRRIADFLESVGSKVGDEKLG